MEIDVSVIVPVYNVHQYIQECLDSLLHQTLKSFEIIVIDDGSTDGSSEICKQYANQHEQIHYYRKENGGLMSAWMEGVKYSNGRYIGFVDSDDYVSPVMYEKMHSMAAKENADVVMCSFFSLYTTGAISPAKTHLDEIYKEDNLEFVRQHAFSSMFNFNISNERWNKIFKRDIIQKNLIYCEGKSRFHEAKYITPACLLDANVFCYIDEPLYYFRSRNSSNSSVVNLDIIPWTEHLYKTQKKMLKDKKMEEYQDKLQQAKIDYIRILFNRFGKTDIRTRLTAAKLIMTKENLSLFKMHKDLCTKFGGKTGVIMYYSLLSQMPIIIAIAMKILKRKNVKKSFE